MTTHSLFPDGRRDDVNPPHPVLLPHQQGRQPFSRWTMNPDKVKADVTHLV